MTLFSIFSLACSKACAKCCRLSEGGRVTPYQLSGRRRGSRELFLSQHRVMASQIWQCSLSFIVYLVSLGSPCPRYGEVNLALPLKCRCPTGWRGLSEFLSFSEVILISSSSI